MQEVNLSEIAELLAGGAFAGFVGMKEDVVFEAKGARPYQLGSAGGRYELAKDVSAFANTEGGHLIVGLITERASNEPVDVVTSLDLLPEGDFPSGQIDGLLRQYIVPAVLGLAVKWVKSVESADLGLGVIEVPRQDEDSKPFLVANVAEQNERIKQIVFGYSRRIGADALPHDVHQLRQAMRQGMSSISQRLSSIEQRLGLLLESAPRPMGTPQSQEEADAVLEERIRRIMGQ